MPWPGCFTPEKETQYPLYRRLGGPEGWPGWVWKTMPPLGFNPQIVQPVVVHYTDYAIPAHNIYMYIYIYLNDVNAVLYLTCHM
jgi:hypothetical protein